MFIICNSCGFQNEIKKSYVKQANTVMRIRDIFNLGHQDQYTNLFDDFILVETVSLKDIKNIHICTKCNFSPMEYPQEIDI